MDAKLNKMLPDVCCFHILWHHQNWSLKDFFLLSKLYNSEHSIVSLKKVNE